MAIAEDDRDQSESRCDLVAIRTHHHILSRPDLWRAAKDRRGIPRAEIAIWRAYNHGLRLYQIDGVGLCRIRP
jgi:hypothetical protein